MTKRKDNIDDIDINDDFELEDIDDFDPFDVLDDSYEESRMVTISHKVAIYLIKKIKRKIRFLYGQEESVRHFCQLFLFW
ncbi:MAG: hypothetical protein ACLTKH_09685 [Eubacterium sp.]